MTSSKGGKNFIQDVNAATVDEAVRILEPIFERSSWLAQRVAGTRPFNDPQDLADRIATEIYSLPATDRLSLLRAHPELSPSAPSLMTDASQREQARLSIGRPAADVATRLRALNERYRTRHGFPFIVALHAAADLESVLEKFASSLEEDTEAEITRALGEVVSVATARLSRLAGAVPDQMVEVEQ